MNYFFLLSKYLADDGERKERDSEREKYQELSGFCQHFFLSWLFVGRETVAVILFLNFFFIESPMGREITALLEKGLGVLFSANGK